MLCCLHFGVFHIKYPASEFYNSLLPDSWNLGFPFSADNILATAFISH